MWRKGNPGTLLVGMYIGITTTGKSMEVPQKTKSGTTMWSSNSTPGYRSKENKNTNLKRYMHPSVCSSIMYNCQDMEEPRCPSKDKVVRRLIPLHTHTYTHEYYSAKKNFSKTQMDLEDIVLSEIRERQILCVITYMWNLKNKTNE